MIRRARPTVVEVGPIQSPHFKPVLSSVTKWVTRNWGDFDALMKNEKKDQFNIGFFLEKDKRRDRLVLRNAEKKFRRKLRWDINRDFGNNCNGGGEGTRRTEEEEGVGETEAGCPSKNSRNKALQFAAVLPTILEIAKFL